MASLNKGIKDVESALTQLDKQSQNLTDGSAEVKKALSQIKKGLDGVSMNTEELQNWQILPRRFRVELMHWLAD